MIVRSIFLVFFLTFLSSCAQQNLVARVSYADELASRASFKKEVLKTQNFYLLTYSRINDASQQLNVYIEGDGFAWKNKYVASDNPTPKNPLALKLAISDPNQNILYVARPCQYVDLKLDGLCQKKFWTNGRFAKEVIASTNEVIETFVKRRGFKKVNLFGYSGGGAVAVLVAALRDDVALIGTVAGNLNHKKLSEIHNISPLDDSLDAIDVAEKVKNIPQFHLIGGKDRAVPPEVVMSFVRKVNTPFGDAKFEIIEEAGHQYDKWDEVVVNFLSTRNKDSAKLK